MSGSPAPTEDGLIPFKIPSIDRPCSTYYKVFGNRHTSIPVICLHGGPFAGHEYMLPFTDLLNRGLSIIFYDQIGCGKSTHLPEKSNDDTFWREEIFTAELDNLIDYLQVRSGYHLLGHSFGGMMIGAYASTQPQGLQKIVLASGLASKPLLNECWRELKLLLPLETQKAIDEALQTRDFTKSEYQQAWNITFRTHMCRQSPFPPEIEVVNKNMMAVWDSITSMFGPSPWEVGGSLKDWTSVSRLHKITAPTLAYMCEYDTTLEIAQKPYFELIPKVRWIVFSGGDHLAHLKGSGVEAKLLQTVGDFLVQA